LGRRTVKVQFEGCDGERYTIKLEGNLSKDKVLRLMDMYELLAQEKGGETIPDDTIHNRVRNIISDRFLFKRFTSDQVRDAFEEKYDRPIKLAEISTYLSRMNNQGEISRSKRGRKWLYTIATATEVQENRLHLQRRTPFSDIIER
jgi:hypothetical protein